VWALWRILNPLIPQADLRSAIRRHCYTDMTALLDRVATLFANPTTTIILSGYYPILSPASHPPLVRDFLRCVGVPILEILEAAPPIPGLALTGDPVTAEIVEQCRVFWEKSTTALRDAVADVNRVRGARLRFASPLRSSRNGTRPWHPMPGYGGFGATRRQRIPWPSPVRSHAIGTSRIRCAASRAIEPRGVIRTSGAQRDMPRRSALPWVSEAYAPRRGRASQRKRFAVPGSSTVGPHAAPPAAAALCNEQLLLLMGLGLLLGFSERALTSFEDKILGGSGGRPSGPG